MPRFDPLKIHTPLPQSDRRHRRFTLPVEPDPDPGDSPAPFIPPTVTENEEKDGFELRFPARPADATLERFRATRTLPREHRWHWHRIGEFWYAKRNPATRRFINDLLDLAAHHEPEPVRLDPARNIVPVDFAPRARE
jgi:hypothetical protein